MTEKEIRKTGSVDEGRLRRSVLTKIKYLLFDMLLVKPGTRLSLETKFEEDLCLSEFDEGFDFLGRYLRIEFRCLDGALEWNGDAIVSIGDAVDHVVKWSV